jgi:hypothetical protein
VHSIILIRVRWPLRCKILPFQADDLSATRSARDWSTDLGSLEVDRGKPKYLIGKPTF